MRSLAPVCALMSAALSACVAPAVNASNGTKMAEAASFAAAAAVAQVVESAAQENARNKMPVTHATYGANVPCDNDGQYPCATVAAWPAETPEPPMTEEEAREYVLDYVDGVRKLNGAGPVQRDAKLDDFAREGSEELARDHKPGQHLADHARDVTPGSGEVQGSPQGSGTGTLQDELAQVLVGMMNEGPGGARHDVLLQPAWRTLGVGIVQEDGRTYFTADFSP